MSVVLLKTKSKAKMNKIIELAKKLAVKDMTLTDKEVEEIEDSRLLRRMNAALAGGLADREEVLKELGR